MADQAGSNRAVVGIVEQAAHTHRLRDFKAVGRELMAAMDRHGVLNDATAIAFRMLFAIAFLSLTGLAFAGAIHLQSIWQRQIGPGVAHIVSPNFYKDLDRSVDQVLTARRWWWLSIGLVLTLWQVSSGIRALMTALDEIYEVKDRRPFWERMGISVALAGVMTVALFLIGGIILVFGSLTPGSDAVRVATFVFRLLLCAGILVAMVSILLRFTVPEHLEVRWLTLGSSISIVIWLFTSWLFGLYVANFAYQGYQQAFGVLSLLVVGMTYLYIAAVAFLIGAELDALLVAKSQEKRRT